VQLRVLHQDDDLIVVDKPAGFHVHPPEDQRHRISKQQNTVYLLRKQTGRYVYPVHRLDRATSGVLLFAFSSEIAGELSAHLREKRIKKIYFAVVRGWVPDEGKIEHPLRADKNDGLFSEIRKEALTLFQSVARWETPFPVGRYSSSRYSLVKVEPVTGRMHQIRRHFAHISHPLIGDSVYGDGKHNRAFRDHLAIEQLMLKAYSLQFKHPRTSDLLCLRSRWEDSWHKLFDSAGQCPLSLP
jgi:tRNA pseudouridine65 synthase